VAATTVREIADDVGILSGSLYHHFESKEAIVDEIISSYLEDLRTRYKQVLADDLDPRARLRSLIVVSLQAAAEHPYATQIYQNEAAYLRRFDRFGYLKSAGREVQNTWLDVINGGVVQGVFRSDIHPRTFCRLVGDAVSLAARWYKPTRDYPVARLADDCTSIFLDGLSARRR
jgi:AcrR family transcriptional regulator